MLGLLSLLVVLADANPARPTPAVENAAWNVAGLPGGEVMSLAADPVEPMRFFAGTSRGSIYRSTDAGRSWTFMAALPDYPYPVVDLQIDSHAPVTVYALAGYEPDRLLTGVPFYGFLFRSDDGGVSWERLIDASAYSLDPHHRGGIYRTVANGSVTRSVDMGRTWSDASPLIGSANSVLTDRAADGVVYAINFSGLLKTTDAGATWTTLPVPPAVQTAPGPAARLQIAGRDGPGSIFLVGGPNVHRSFDGGQTWSTSPLGTASTVYQLSGDRNPGGALFAATDKGVFRSDDLGQTWSGGDFFLGYPIRAVAAAGGGVLVAGTFRGGLGLYRSEDRGGHWSLSNSGFLDSSATTIAPDPSRPSRVFAGGPGIFRSDDFGSTWSAVDLTRRPSQIRVDPSDGNRLYAVENGAFWRSVDAGTVWNLTAVPASPYDVVIDAGGTVFANTDAGLFRSHDAGSTWTAANNTPSGQGVLVITADPRIPGVVYGTAWIYPAYSNAVYKSVDEGTSWTGPIVSTALLETVVDLADDGRFPSTLYVARSFHERFISYGSVASTSNEGASWKGVFSADDVRSIVLDPVRPGILYVSVPASAYGSASVYRVSPDRITLYGLVGIGALRMEISSDGTVLYAVTNDGRFARRLTASGAPRSTLVPPR